MSDWAVVWAVGAVLMAVLGPTPCWLSGHLMQPDGADLPAFKRWTVWCAQVALWPAALIVYSRWALYGR